MNGREAVAVITAALDAGEVSVVRDFDVTAGILAGGGQAESPPIVFLIVDAERAGGPAERSVLALALDDSEVAAAQLVTAVRETRSKLRARRN